MYTFGTLSYLVNKNEDEVSCVYTKDNNMYMSPFKLGLQYIEMNLQNLEKNIENDSSYTINDLIDYTLKTSKRKMIMIVISDIMGLNNIDEKLVRRATMAHDMLFVNINDASMYGEDVFDVEQDSDLPKFITNNKKILEIENMERERVKEEKTNMLKKYRVTTGEIGSKSEIVNKLIDLLERHNNAVRR